MCVEHVCLYRGVVVQWREERRETAAIERRPAVDSVYKQGDKEMQDTKDAKVGVE